MDCECLSDSGLALTEEARAMNGLLLLKRGDLLITRNVGFRNVMDRAMPESNGKLPELVFAFYQMVRPLTLASVTI